MLRLLAAFMLIVCASPAFAQAFTGAEMLEPCTAVEKVMAGQMTEAASAARPDVLLQGFCLGTAIGMRYLVNEATKNLGDKAICIPNASTGLQIMDAVGSFLRGNEGRHKEEFNFLVMEAYLRFFPCKK